MSVQYPIGCGKLFSLEQKKDPKHNVIPFAKQLFEYERLVRILLHGVSYREQEGFVQRIAIYLLNSLACQVDGSQKMFLGDLGAISVSLSISSTYNGN